MTKLKGMKLGRILNVVPGNQLVVVKDYLSGSRYANDKVSNVISKILDYNQELRNSQVYGVSVLLNNILCVEVLLEDK